MEQHTYGGIEFGGTKTICAIGGVGGDITNRITIPTTIPDETLAAVYDFFEQNPPITVLGVGCFGPLDLDSSSGTFGQIRSSPKAGWSDVDIKGLLEKRLKLPVNIDTDVMSAAIGEHAYGVAQQASNFVYLTVGTGIGGAIVIGGKPFHGRSHSEIGHIRIPHEPFGDGFTGTCPYHGDCLEGIASGLALEKRWGSKTGDIMADLPWELEAEYLGAALADLLLILSPELIVLGGGVMHHIGLIEAIRSVVARKIHGYIEVPNLAEYIVTSSGELNGVLGAIKLASERR